MKSAYKSLLNEMPFDLHGKDSTVPMFDDMAPYETDLSQMKEKPSEKQNKTNQNGTNINKRPSMSISQCPFSVSKLSLDHSAT